ncbi:DEAD/DEAH box helicase [Lactiplantibacillus plantarum]|uniref:DEAD/DEAH box helicase family protein n=1 Tax=Lactiplantibacillus plantarum TaxID=1590 RepID=UPI0038344077|nr:DEAD/DEAH box helicase [Lactiplantibacillus plantarum]MCG0642380.1 DEAD/DEAH box helicase [Lactiplantibacillus plantarum]MCG0645462.1 DEAD/DEAH box helicase [Lactiplantibacillus plantarum]MCG0651772.1 DEAD/DEAH box helicase [Lactiplantibacillus plantarum]MCG0771607.1 DEAD/DEAH box helicase [Lactiplantibacillus plantarum]
MPFKLFDYQQRIVDETRQKIAQGNNGVLIVSPPGSGKSVIIAEIARLTVSKGGRILFFVHRQELVNQIVKSFQKQDVDLMNCTIMTVGKVANRLDHLPKPNLIICDESQHSRAKTYLKIFKYYSDVPRLGFSGSPWRMNGAGFDDIYSAMVKGPTVKWLIEHKKLSPYKYYSVTLFNDEKLKKSSTGDYTNQSINDSAKPTLYGDIVKTWMDKAFGQRTIVYAHDTQHSKQIATEFRKAGISAKHCDSKTPSDERKRIMSDFRKGKITVLCNFGLVDEGYDVKECTCCVIARPTESLVFDIQATMRCMRYLPNKMATIIDHAANYTRFGLPDTPRQWSLTGRPKKKGNNTSALPIRTCPHCWAVIPAQCKVCPQCGEEIPIDNEGMDTQDNVELEKVGEFKMTTDYQNNQYGKMKPDDADNVEDLYKIAKARGYKPGWAYMNAKRRGMLG